MKTKFRSFLSFTKSLPALANTSGPFVGFKRPKNKITFPFMLYFCLNLFGEISLNKIGSTPFGIVIIFFLSVYFFKVSNSHGVIETTLSINLKDNLFKNKSFMNMKGFKIFGRKASVQGQ